MSSAIILSAASTNFFWSTAAAATGAAAEPELGLDLVGLGLDLVGSEGLGEERSLLDFALCGSGAAGFRLRH